MGGFPDTHLPPSTPRLHGGMQTHIYSGSGGGSGGGSGSCAGGGSDSGSSSGSGSGSGSNPATGSGTSSGWGSGSGSGSSSNSAGGGAYVATGVVYIASGIQSFSTTDVGSETFASVDGSPGSLTLANAGAVYTIDELETNEAETDSSGSFSYTNADTGASGHDSTLAVDNGYSLSIENIGSLTESGGDTVASDSAGIGYSSDGGSEWAYSGFGGGGTTEAAGDATHGSDFDIYGTDYSDADLGEEESLNRPTRRARSR